MAAKWYKIPSESIGFLARENYQHLHSTRYFREPWLLRPKVTFHYYTYTFILNINCDDGLVQNALDWFKSYLTDRVQSVHVNGSPSPVRHLTCGLPQGSLLGSQLFPFHVAPVAKIIRKNNLMFHFFAGDAEI